MLTLEAILKTTRQMTAYGEFDRTTRRPDATAKRTSEVVVDPTDPRRKEGRETMKAVAEEALAFVRYVVSLDGAIVVCTWLFLVGLIMFWVGS